MGGGAWPFLVGGAICLVNSDNERDSNLLNSWRIEVKTAVLNFYLGHFVHRDGKRKSIYLVKRKSILKHLISLEIGEQA